MLTAGEMGTSSLLVAPPAADLDLGGPSAAALLDTAYQRLSGRRGPGAGRPTKLYQRSGRQVSVTLPEGGVGTGSFIGDGPIDAVFQAINSATGVAATLSEFTIGAVTEGQDALGEVSVVLEVAGVAGAGQGVSTDIIDAAARAYVRALSVAVARSRADQAIGLPEASPG